MVASSLQPHCLICLDPHLSPEQVVRAARQEKDWNAEFQQILECEDEGIEKWRRLARLAKDFAYSSKLFAKVIISELYLPEESKTIKPATFLGGVAGGDKYICQGILFKVPRSVPMTA